MDQDDDLIEGAPLWPNGPTSLMHLLRRAGQRTSTNWSAAVENGISQIQYAALIVLDEAGTCDQQTMGSRVGIDKATGTYVVDKMVQAGLIDTQTDPVNRRRKLITLTAAGRKALKATIPQAKRAEELVGARLSQSEIATLMNLLSRLSGVREVPTE